MEFVKDNGVAWRRKFISLVREVGLDIDLIDPTNKPGESVGENHAYQVELQRSGQFRALQQYVKRYRHLDLRYTDISDFLIIVIDPTVPQWGTSNEVYLAEDQQKPLFFVCEQGLYSLPRWLFSVIDPIESDDPVQAMQQANIYTSIEDVVTELQKLDRGEKPLSDEWVLVRKLIEQRRHWLEA
jgi:hypothetical protein